MFSLEEWEENTERDHRIEQALLRAIEGGAATTQDIVAAAHDTILKKHYDDMNPFIIRLHLLRLLQRGDCIKKEFATAYAITEEGREYLDSPHSKEELAANYVRNLIQARNGGKV